MKKVNTRENVHLFLMVNKIIKLSFNLIDDEFTIDPGIVCNNKLDQTLSLRKSLFIPVHPVCENVLKLNLLE